MLEHTPCRLGRPCPDRRMGMISTCVAAIVVFLGVAAADAKEPLAIFHVGNSLTDQAYGMHDIAAARGQETKFGRHMIPGAPLQWLWDHRNEGFRAPDAQKSADEILKNNKWDVLILQPFGRSPENSIEYGAQVCCGRLRGESGLPSLCVLPTIRTSAKSKRRRPVGDSDGCPKPITRGRATFQKVADGISALFPGQEASKNHPGRRGHVSATSADESWQGDWLRAHCRPVRGRSAPEGGRQIPGSRHALRCRVPARSA